MAKILVVDDEKIIVKGIRFSLLQDQMEVDCAYDGEQAVEMARNTEYDVVLLDVMLPKLDGFQVCQAIREFSNMPIIMLTAKGEDMDKILDEARVTSDPAARKQCYTEVQKIIDDEAICVPLLQPANAVAYNADLKGVDKQNDIYCHFVYDWSWQ